MNSSMLDTIQREKSTFKSLFDFKDIYFILEDNFKESNELVLSILQSFKKININYKSANILQKNFNELKNEYPFMVMQIQKDQPFDE